MRVLLILFLVASLIFYPVQNEMSAQDTENIKLFLCGDVMLGRGIDQAFQKSVAPVLYESYVKDARSYIQLAKSENGHFSLPVSYRYIWGDAIEVWRDQAPDLKLINLETSITTNDDPWEGKGIHYRMHPENVKALTIAGIDYCGLANNHIMDWGRKGLEETLSTLNKAEIKYSGAGSNKDLAVKPSILKAEKNKVLVFSYGAQSSGIPPAWAASSKQSGVSFLKSIDPALIPQLEKHITSYKNAGDIVIFSVHWGSNWGYDIPKIHREFAHKLIDEAGVDIIFGHSSHHPLGIEVYREKLIIYGAGDFINDYEGISGQQKYRGELTLMYFPEIDPGSGNLKSLKLVPMEIKKFRLQTAKRKDTNWLRAVLNREGKKFGTQVIQGKDENFHLKW